MIPQQKFIVFDHENRYKPVKEKSYGFVVLRDSLAEGPETYYDDEEVDPNAPNPWKDNLEVPEPFDFDPAVQFGS